jgi:histone-lysine N-methyltransferase SETMAR
LGQKKVVACSWCPHYNFLNAGETINVAKLTKCTKSFVKKQPALVNQKGKILLHDNARRHVPQLTLWKLRQLSYETLPHPPYSSDLSPTDHPFFIHLDDFLQKKIINNQSRSREHFSTNLSVPRPQISTAVE